MKKLALLFLIFSARISHAETPAAAPAFHTSEPVNIAGFTQMFVGLLFVLMVIAAVVYFMRRLGTFTHLKHNHIKVLSGITVGQRERIMLLQVSDQQLLIGIAPGSIRTLHVLEKPVSDDQSTQITSQKFADRLQAILKQKLQ